MFTGIVEATGRLTNLETSSNICEMTFSIPQAFNDLHNGDSVSVNGVCLTVKGCLPDSFAADVMGITLARTNLGRLEVGSSVNLERAMKVDSRFGGHIVQGHIDCVSALLNRTAHELWETFRFTLPREVAPLVVERGSVALNGVSLTVSAVSDEEGWFEVSLIPTTLQQTVLGSLRIGEEVNLESDVVARHIEKLMKLRHD